MDNKNIEFVENIKTTTQLTEEIIRGVKYVDSELDYLYNYQELLNNHYISCVAKNPEGKAEYKKMKGLKEMAEIERIKKLFNLCEDLIEMYRDLMMTKKPYLKLIERCNAKNIRFTFNFDKDKNNYEGGQDFYIDCDFEKDI